MPSFHTIVIDIIDIEVPMSTKPSIRLSLISTKRCNVLLRWLLLTLILHITCNLSTLVKFIVFKQSLCFFLTTFTKLFNDSSSLGMAKIVSIGDNEILPFMKWFNILEWTKEFLPIYNCPISLSSLTSTSCISTSMRLLRIWALEKTSCFVPHNLFNCSNLRPWSCEPKLQGNCWMQMVFCSIFPIFSTCP
jgi:hypothetical protein